MPIRPENRHRYPAVWKEIRAAILERAGNRCEFCGVPNHEVGIRDAEGRFWGYDDPASDPAWTADAKIVKVVLTIAHLDHQPEHNDPANLRALCQRCHLAYDAKRKAADRRSRRYSQQPALFEVLT